MSQLLVIIVAVLATVVSMALIVVIIWSCVLWNRKKRKRKWCCHQPDQSHSRGAYGFPPQREMIEMGCLHASNNCSAPQQQSAVCNNNTGASKCLGLGASYMMDQLPALPAPRSWTPSPPFDSHHMNIKSKSLPLSRVAEMSHLSKLRMGEPYASRRSKSKSVIYPELISFRKSASAPKVLHQEPVPCQQCHNSDFVEVNLKSDSSDNEKSIRGVYLSPHTKSARFKLSSKLPVRKTPESKVHQFRTSTKSAKTLNQIQQFGGECIINGGSKNNHEDEFIEHPVACSSSCGSPRVLPPIPFSSCDSFHNAHCSNKHQEKTSVFNFVKHDKNNAQKDLSCRRKTNNLEMTRRGVSMLPQIVETSPTLDSTFESISRSPVKFAEHHHTSRYQIQDRLYPSSPKIVQSPSVFNPSTPKNDEVIARNFSEKYGFCLSCGKHPDVHRTVGGLKLITRSTQTHWTRCRSRKQMARPNRDVTIDPTPSLSWDNLTPAPSPIPTLGHIVENSNDDNDGNGNNDDRNEDMFHDGEGCEEGAVGGW